MVIEKDFYIIAGSIDQAKYWAKSWNLKSYVYIHSSYQLSGIRKFKFARVGTWCENPEIDKIEERIESAEGIEVSNSFLEVQDEKA